MKRMPPLNKNVWGDEKYHDFDEVTRKAGSIPPAIAFEAPQEEIVSIIEKAGLIPSETDNTQLYQAIKKIFDSSGFVPIPHALGEIFTDGFVELLDGQGWCEGDVLPSGAYAGLVAEFEKYSADNTKGIAHISFAIYEQRLVEDKGNCILFGYDAVNNLIRLPSVQDGVGIFQANTIAENGKFYNDQLQGHKHETPINSTSGTGRFTNGTVNDSGFNIGTTINATHTLTSATLYDDGVNGTPRVGNETRNKQIRRRFKVQLANIGVKSSESQYAEFVEGLNNKADKNLENVDLATAMAVTPNVLQTLQNNVAETIAKSGWLVATGRSTSTDGKALVVTLNGVLLPSSSYTGVGAAFGSISIIVAAGDVVQVVSGLLLKAEILEIKGGIK